MCLHLSVILIMGGSVSHTPPGQTPHWADKPSPCTQADTPPGQTPPGHTSPLPSACWDTPPTPPAQYMLGYGQQAGGTHPIGMHTCSTYDQHSLLWLTACNIFKKGLTKTLFLRGIHTKNTLPCFYIFDAQICAEPIQYWKHMPPYLKPSIYI